MTDRFLMLAIAVFAGLASAYVVFFLRQPQSLQSKLRDVHGIGLAVPAAVLAFCFQLRLSRISRLDAWARDYQNLLRGLAEWLGRYFDEPYTAEDCARVARYFAQAEGLAATLDAIGVKLSAKTRGSVRALCDDLYQQSGCSVGTPRSDGLAPIFENSMYEHIRAAPGFISGLYR